MTNLSDTVKQDLAEFNKLDQNRKMAVIAIIFGLFVISIIVGANLTKNAGTPSSTTPTSGAVENAKPSTTVALSPAKATLKVGQATTIEVTLSKLAVTAADIMLTYDPKLVTVTKLTNGTVLPVLTVPMTNVDGKITYNASLSESNPTDRTEGVLFSFTITPKVTGSAMIDFDHTKTITAINGENTLGSTVGGIYTIE